MTRTLDQLNKSQILAQIYHSFRHNLDAHLSSIEHLHIIEIASNYIQAQWHLRFSADTLTRPSSPRRNSQGFEEKVTLREPSKQQKPVSASQDTIDQAMLLCDEENKNFNEQPGPTDVGLWRVTSKKDTCLHNLPHVLLNLYWRARKQIAVFEILCTIYLHGQFSADALAILVNYRRTPDNVRNVMRMLACFSKMSDLEDPPSLGDRYTLVDFSEPLHWLAVMVCRSCH